MRVRAWLSTSTVLTIALSIGCGSSGGPSATGAAGTGTTGAAGTGTTGAAGTGTTGAAGTGTTGAAGTGTTGAAGTGTTGAAGTGAAGTTGVAGAGAAGATGAAGAGAAGATGAAGTGAAGTNGAAGTGAPFAIPTVTWPSAACKTMATTLVGMMTRPEKAAQMVMAPMDQANAAAVQAAAPGAVFAPGGYKPGGGSGAMAWATMNDGYIDAGTKTAHQIPFLIGADAVHGANIASGTVIFPHNAGLGGTRNPALVQEVQRIAALEVAATGLNWTFAPVVSVSWDDRWGRVYESFSEDPAIAAQLAAAATMGLQGAMGLGKTPGGIVGCSKHWAGDGQATPMTSSKGAIVDRGNIMIDEPTMRKFGIAPYLGAIQAGLGSIMVSDARWNGTSLTVSSRAITEILKTELKFQGFVSTDWNAATESPGATIVTAVNAGVDMLMHPADWKGAITTIANSASIPEARITDAATRIIQTKCEAGLFGKKRDTALMASVGSTEHREVGRRAVRESMVLLQNNANTLPLTKASKVYVGGSGANSMANQCGGWTITWQGDGSQTTGTTISAAIGKVATVVPNMMDADAIVIVLSEKPYAEFQGDSMTLNTLPAADFTLLANAKATNKKVVAIVMSGRPVLIANQLANAGAWIAAWLPGTEGTGVADVLFGDYKPTGKLSHSWPKTDADTRINMGDPGYAPLFMLGHGLTY